MVKLGQEIKIEDLKDLYKLGYNDNSRFIYITKNDMFELYKHLKKVYK